jgi:hypothetical protein
MGKFQDLSGKKYFRLLVIERDKKRSGVFWTCICDCGNTKSVSSLNLKSGNSKSCGCYKKERIKISKSSNILGLKFGRLTAIEETENRNRRSIIWKCLCECGNVVYVPSGRLKSNHTLSCGCYKSDKSSSNLINKRFGLLLVVEKTPRRMRRGILWACRCDCGNMVEVSTANLTNKKTWSCGCKKYKSKGESTIEDFLSSFSIYFKKEYVFKDCKDISYLRFDFYLPEYNTCIEYQGEQHYGVNSYWGGEKELTMRKKRDRIKEEYCRNNNINLVIIGFWDYENIFQILSSLFGSI